jgi:epoxyqueuosine reductase
LAASYYTPGQNGRQDAAAPKGRIARYAWGKDYHEALRGRCHALVEAIARELGYRPGARVFVDSSPLVDRAVAQKAGVGWYGKNTNILIHGLGSWAFLAAIVLDVDLPEDEPLLTNCGSCDLCIRACPTGALIDQYTLDNHRCISFQTIENRGSIPEGLRPLMGDWVFGCDICQDVCPVNRKTSSTPIPEFQETDGSVPLSELLLMETAAYQQRFRGRAVKRAKQRGLQRNAAIALGNTGDRDAVGILNKGMESTEGVVRGHVAWAMGRLGGKAARRALEASRDREQDPEVLREIESALTRT